MSEHAALTQQLFHVLIRPLRETAHRLGYALSVHGSLARDIDLVAIPWTDEAVDARTLAEGLQGTIKLILRPSAGFLAPPEAADPYFQQGCPGGKPHGRRVWSFHLGGGPYVDLSVMPREQDWGPACTVLQEVVLERVSLETSAAPKTCDECEVMTAPPCTVCGAGRCPGCGGGWMGGQWCCLDHRCCVDSPDCECASPPLPACNGTCSCGKPGAISWPPPYRAGGAVCSQSYCTDCAARHGLDKAFEKWAAENPDLLHRLRREADNRKRGAK